MSKSKRKKANRNPNFILPGDVYKTQSENVLIGLFGGETCLYTVLSYDHVNIQIYVHQTKTFETWKNCTDNVLEEDVLIIRGPKRV